MKNILILALLISFAQGDIVKKETLACPSIEALRDAPLSKEDDAMSLSLYSIANDCIIISHKDKIEAVGYDPLNTKEMFQKIIYKKTGATLYILKSSINVEQGGKKNTMRF